MHVHASREKLNDTTQARYISACHVNDTFTQNHTIFMYLTPKSQLMTSKIQLPSSSNVMLLGHDIVCLWLKCHMHVWKNIGELLEVVPSCL